MSTHSQFGRSVGLSLCASAIELNEELGLEPAASLVLVGAPHGQHRVHLVDEDHCRLDIHTYVSKSRRKRMPQYCKCGLGRNTPSRSPLCRCVAEATPGRFPNSTSSSTHSPFDSLDYLLHFQIMTTAAASSNDNKVTWWYPATAKRVRTIFSPSPIHLLHNDDAEMEKNVAPDWCAMALPIRVLPGGICIGQRENEDKNKRRSYYTGKTPLRTGVRRACRS